MFRIVVGREDESWSTEKNFPCFIFYKESPGVSLKLDAYAEKFTR